MKAARLRYRKHDYVSDFEQFLGDYLDDHPHVEPGQQRGWFILWDRKVDQADLTVRRDDAVPARGYQYD